MSLLKKYTFWTKIMMTIQAIGTFTQLSLIFGDSKHVYNVIVALVQLSGLVLPIWMEDKDGNGEVDIFEKEVTVTSASPIQVEVKTKDDG